jgi:hypothetical protein
MFRLRVCLNPAPINLTRFKVENLPLIHRRFAGVQSQVLAVDACARSL